MALDLHLDNKNNRPRHAPTPLDAMLQRLARDADDPRVRAWAAALLAGEGGPRDGRKAAATATAK